LRLLFGNGHCIRAPEELLRIGFEFIVTTVAAEMVSRALMLTRRGTVGRIDLHAAHWIFRPPGAEAWFLVPFVIMAVNLHAYLARRAT
jgi:hypothetical protein